MLNSSKGEEGILVTRGVFSMYLNVKKVWLQFFSRGECSVLSTVLKSNSFQNVSVTFRETLVP